MSDNRNQKSDKDIIIGISKILAKSYEDIAIEKVKEILEKNGITDKSEIKEKIEAAELWFMQEIDNSKVISTDTSVDCINFDLRKRKIFSNLGITASEEIQNLESIEEVEKYFSQTFKKGFQIKNPERALEELENWKIEQSEEQQKTEAAAKLEKEQKRQTEIDEKYFKYFREVAKETPNCNRIEFDKILLKKIISKKEESWEVEKAEKLGNEEAQKIGKKYDKEINEILELEKKERIEKQKQEQKKAEIEAKKKEQIKQGEDKNKSFEERMTETKEQKNKNLTITPPLNPKQPNNDEAKKQINNANTWPRIHTNNLNRELVKHTNGVKTALNNGGSTGKEAWRGFLKTTTKPNIVRPNTRGTTSPLFP